MTIKMIADMFFAQYNEIDISVEMYGGMRGKRKTYTKETFYAEFNGWLDEAVVTVSFETHYTFCGEIVKKMDRPILFIGYAQ